MDEKALMADAFTQIEKRIFFGDRLRERQFLSLSNPGQFVSPNLDEANPVQAYIQSQLADQVLDASWVFKDKVGRISDLYGEVLEFAKLPQLTLTGAQQQEIRDREQWLRLNQANYDRYENRYDTAFDGYMYESLDDPTSPRLQRLLDKKNRAMHEWETLGRRIEHERYEARIAYLNSGDPNLYWQGAKDLYQNSKVSIASPLREYYPTLFYPPVLDWESSSWATIEMETYERESSYYSRSTSWGGSAGISFGLWTIGGGASGHSEERKYHSQTSRVRIKFDFLRVKLIRPWLRDSVFSLRSWDWKNTHDQTPLSDGAEPPVGRMPLLTTSFLVARNLELSASWSEYDLQYRHSEFNAGASVGWGPFRIRGSYHTETTEEDINYDWQGDTLKVGNPQIIGYLGALLPHSPFPDPSLAWESTTPIARRASESYVQMLLERRVQEDERWAVELYQEQRQHELASEEHKREIESQRELGKLLATTRIASINNAQAQLESFRLATAGRE